MRTEGALASYDQREREGLRPDRQGLREPFRTQGLRQATMFRKTQHIHLVGIGGSGMSGIAEVLLTLGYKVSGSDLSQSETTRRLEELGGRIAIGHQESNIGEAQVVVISSAVAATNPEVVAAKAKQIPVIPRAEMLAELMRLKFGVAIAGAHGKTTTTSMVANVLAQGGLDPTMVIGGKVNALGSHARLGRGDLLIAEADESDGSFLRLAPTIAAVTNIDREHLDHYGTMERLNDSFLEFMNKVPFYGLAVLCADDERLRELLPRVVKRYQTYGLHEHSGHVPDFRATDISLRQWGSEFRVFFRGKNLGPFRLAIPGIHNVSNSLIAIAIGMELEIPVDLIRKGTCGVYRRGASISSPWRESRNHGHRRLRAPSHRSAGYHRGSQAGVGSASRGAVPAASVQPFPGSHAGICPCVRSGGCAVHDGNLCGGRTADSRCIGRKIGRGRARRRTSVSDLRRTQRDLADQVVTDSEVRGSCHHPRRWGHLEGGLGDS